MITVVGLGRNNGDLTANGLKAVKAADKLFVRTVLSDAGRQVKKFAPVSMDDLYETAENFDELNGAIADRVLAADAPGADIVYCVDGDGFTDASVSALVQKNPELKFIAGVSDAVPAVPVPEVQTVSANGLNAMPDTSAPLIVRDLTDPLIAGEAKLWLLRWYGGEEEAFFFRKGGWQKITVAELDRQKKYDYHSYAFIPAQKDFQKQRYGYADLLRIMFRLCAPDGCPWDKAQTHESIAKNALEEADELVEAIRLNDIQNILEESGDVILQGVFHGVIGQRFGEFTPDDVIDALCKKLVSRHTHVFGGNQAANAEEALAFWKAAKAKEKK